MMRLRRPDGPKSVRERMPDWIVLRDKLEQRLKQPPDWERTPRRRRKGRAAAWVVALGAGILVGGLLGAISDIPPGLIGVIAALVVVGTGLVGGRVRRMVAGAPE